MNSQRRTFRIKGDLNIKLESGEDTIESGDVVNFKKGIKFNGAYNPPSKNFVIHV